MNGRSSGTTRIASAPPATASSRPSRTPALSPFDRCRSVRAPALRGGREDVPVRADDEDVGDRRRAGDGVEGPFEQAAHEVVALLGIERLAEAGLGALDRGDRDDRRDAQAVRVMWATWCAGVREQVGGQARPAGGVGHDRVGDVGSKAERRDRRLERGIHRVQHERVRVRGEDRGDARRRCLVAERHEHPVGRSLQRLAADDAADGHHGDTRVPGVGDRLGHPGHGQDRAQRHDRVRRSDDDEIRLGQRFEDGVGRPGGLDALEADLVDLGALVAMDEVLLEVEPAVVGADLGPDRGVGHRQDPRRETHGGLQRQHGLGHAWRRPRIRAVRAMWVAKSRSPSPNQPSSP